MADWNLSYEDMEALRPKLIPRIKSAVVKFLLYTQGGGGSPSQGRIDWCSANLSNTDQLAQQLSPYLMSEPGFIQGGTSITDTAIQSRVEFVLGTYFMPA